MGAGASGHEAIADGVGNIHVSGVEGVVGGLRVLVTVGVAIAG